MPGKRKYDSCEVCAQAIGQEGGDGSAQCARSMISTIALLHLSSLYHHQHIVITYTNTFRWDCTNPT